MNVVYVVKLTVNDINMYEGAQDQDDYSISPLPSINQPIGGDATMSETAAHEDMSRICQSFHRKMRFTGP